MMEEPGLTFRCSKAHSEGYGVPWYQLTEVGAFSPYTCSQCSFSAPASINSLQLRRKLCHFGYWPNGRARLSTMRHSPIFFSLARLQHLPQLIAQRGEIGNLALDLS